MSDKNKQDKKTEISKQKKSGNKLWTGLKKNIGKILYFIIIAGLTIFIAKSQSDLSKERKARIETQNKIADLSEIIKESKGTWSRLSKQQEDIIEDLRLKNSDLADKIEENGERLFVLTESILKFKPISINVEKKNVSQKPAEEDPKRIKVSFNQTVDPIRVEGFTLTNPAEAKLQVSFIKSLKIRTSIVQRKDGSWNSYLEGDWDNLEIENIETLIEPYKEPKLKRALGNIILGTDFGISVNGKVGLMMHGIYEIGKFGIGPSFGFIDGDFTFGVSAQWRPF